MTPDLMLVFGVTLRQCECVLENPVTLSDLPTGMVFKQKALIFDSFLKFSYGTPGLQIHLLRPHTLRNTMRQSDTRNRKVPRAARESPQHAGTTGQGGSIGSIGEYGSVGGATYRLIPVQPLLDTGVKRSTL